jgi:hypothetical protein
MSRIYRTLASYTRVVLQYQGALCSLRAATTILGACLFVSYRYPLTSRTRSAWPCRPTSPQSNTLSNLFRQNENIQSKEAARKTTLPAVVPRSCRSLVCCNCVLSPQWSIRESASPRASRLEKWRQLDSDSKTALSGPCSALPAAAFRAPGCGNPAAAVHPRSSAEGATEGL